MKTKAKLLQNAKYANLPCRCGCGGIVKQGNEYAKAGCGGRMYLRTISPQRRSEFSSEGGRAKMVCYRSVLLDRLAELPRNEAIWRAYRIGRMATAKQRFWLRRRERREGAA